MSTEAARSKEECGPGLVDPTLLDPEPSQSVAAPPLSGSPGQGFINVQGDACGVLSQPLLESRLVHGRVAAAAAAAAVRRASWEGEARHSAAHCFGAVTFQCGCQREAQPPRVLVEDRECQQPQISRIMSSRCKVPMCQGKRRADSCMQETRVENSRAPKPEEGRGGRKGKRRRT